MKRQRNKVYFAVFIILMYTASGACFHDDGKGDFEKQNKNLLTLMILSPALEVGGNWGDSFSNRYVIDWNIWEMYDAFSKKTYVNSILYVNQASRVLYYKNASNGFNPGKYSRIEWILIDKNRFYMCTSVYNAATIEDAEAATFANRSDPANSGCGGFAWSLLSR